MCVCVCVCVLITQSCPTLVTPWTVGHQAPLSMGFSRQAMGCHSPLQGIFLTRGWNVGLLHYRQILYHPSHQGSPSILYTLFNAILAICREVGNTVIQISEVRT